MKTNIHGSPKCIIINNKLSSVIFFIYLQNKLEQQLSLLFTCSLMLSLHDFCMHSLHALCMLFTSSHVVTQILLSVSPGKPTGYGPSSRRSHNRGIVDECCFQSCELRRLEMYCAPVKSGKAARSVRAQRHTDMPRTPKVSTAVQNVDRGTERRTAQHPDKTKTKKVSTAPNRYTF